MPFLGKNFKRSKEKKEKIKSEKYRNGGTTLGFGKANGKVNKNGSNRAGTKSQVQLVVEIERVYLYFSVPG